MAPQNPKPDVKVKRTTLLKVLRPLILLVVPVVLLIVSYYVPEPVGFWLRVAAAVLFAGIGIWVTIRLVLYLREVVALRRQKELLKKQDPLFIAETRMHERLVKVHNSFREARMGIYDLPYYLVLGHNDHEFGEMLQDGGLTVPANLSEAFEPKPHDLETWNITNEAVFINVSRTLRDKESEPEWELLLKALASDRPAAPISGAIVVLPIDHLTEPSAEIRKERELLLQKRLQKMQTELQISFPVYLIVSGIDRMTGFAEFFGEMDEVHGDQIFGWSNTDAELAEFDVTEFGKELEKLSNNVKAQEFRRMEVQSQTESLDRVYYFSAEFDILLESAKEVVGNVFGPNQFLEPIPLRGFYLVGSLAPLPPVGFELQGPLGECKPAVPDALTELQTERHSWFSKDLFKEKIIAEAGGINRPAWVIKQQKRRKLISAGLMAAVAALGIAGMANGILEALDWSSRTQPVLDNASTLIENGGMEGQIFQSMNEVAELRAELDNIDVVLSLWAAGRYQRLNDDLGQVHRALFQRRYLKGLIASQEQAFEDWRGDGSFSEFNAALIEYIRWANPHNADATDLSIEPFLQHQNVDAALRDNIRENYRLFLEQEDGRSSLLVRQGSRTLIVNTLVRINAYLNPTEPAELDQDDMEMVDGESNWWLQMALSLEDVSKAYRDLLQHLPPEPGSSHEELDESINELHPKLATTAEKADDVRGLLREGEINRVGWISLDRLFDGLKDAATDWDQLLPAVAATRKSAEIYRERVENPIHDQIHLAALFFNEPGYPKMSEELAFVLSGEEVDSSAKEEEETPPQESAESKDAFQAFRVGTNVLQMMRRLDTYMSRLDEADDDDSGLSDSFEEDKTSDLDTIRERMVVIRDDSRKKLALLKDVHVFFENLEGLAEKVEGPSTEDDDLKAKAAQTALSEVKNLADIGDEREKRAIAKALDSYHWDFLNPWGAQWTAALEREQAYQTSLSWMDVFYFYSPVDASQSDRSWNQILRSRPFVDANGLYYMSGLSEFIDEWLNGLPQDLKAVVTTGPDAPAVGDNAEFVEMYKQVGKLKTEYLPALRGASKKFVTCVNSMKSSASKSWKKLYKTSDIEEEGKGKGPTWGAFESFSNFQELYEVEQGNDFANITDPLITVEQEVVGTFEDQLADEFSRSWKKILREGRKSGLNSAFPFAELAGETTYQEMFDFVAQLEGLAISYGLETESAVAQEDPEEEEEPLYYRSEQVLEQVISTSRRAFLLRCLAFKKFLVGDEEHGAPEVLVKIVPGEIGRHYHWIRIRMSDGSYYDVNVYGDKAVTIRLAPGMGRIVFQGLSVDKTILAKRKVGKGDFGLLQLPYLSGKNTGGKRKIWRVPAEIKAPDTGGEMVSFDLVFEFSKALPVLPRWRN